MIRLGISVEGATEREFVNRVLKPHLLQYGISVVKPVSLDGGVSMRRVKDEIRMLAKQFDVITTLYDLYGFQGRDNRDARQLELAIAEAAGNISHFIPYVQQYEFEALLFSAPEVVAAEFFAPASVQKMHAIIRECGMPEAINHGYNTCPSRRLHSIFSAYDKVRHGSVLAEKSACHVLPPHALDSGIGFSGWKCLATKNPDTSQEPGGCM